MIDYMSFGDINKLAVHKDACVFSVGQANGTFCVGDILTFCPADTPFVFSQSWIISRVNDSELTLRERNFAKGVPEANPPI